MKEEKLQTYVDAQLEEEKNTVKDAEDYREFEYGHLIFECHRCSHRETIEQDVKNGISIFLPTTNKHEWVIACPRCKNVMRFFYIESFFKPNEVEVIEEVKTKKKRTKKVKLDESKESNKEETSL